MVFMWCEKLLGQPARIAFGLNLFVFDVDLISSVTLLLLGLSLLRGTLGQEEVLPGGVGTKQDSLRM